MTFIGLLFLFIGLFLLYTTVRRFLFFKSFSFHTAKSIQQKQLALLLGAVGLMLFFVAVFLLF